jgi:hypothetical protein
MAGIGQGSALASPAVKDRSPKARRLAVRLLTGSTGRLAAFLIDLGAAGAVYWSRRLAGRETPW